MQHTKKQVCFLKYNLNRRMKGMGLKVATVNLTNRIAGRKKGRMKKSEEEEVPIFRTG